jgi:hypothetical protein
MILDILTVLFFILGFALLFWMIGERRRDVLHYVTKSRNRMVARKRPSERRSSMSKAADELSRVVRDIERDTNSSDEPKAKGKSQ